MHPWVILIEQLEGSGQSARWRPSLSEYSYATREDARRAAQKLAHRHVPPHPYRAGQRTVLQHDEDTWTVIIEGITMNGHFRLSVCRNVTT